MMKYSFKKPFFIINFIISFIFLISCEKETPVKPFYEGIYEGRNESIGEFIQSKKDTFSRFRDLMIEGELDRTLTAYNPHGNNYTLFLPTNDAFDRFISNYEKYDNFQELLNDKEYIKVLVRYHTLNTAFERNDFPFGALPDTTLSGDNLIIGYSGDVDSTIINVNNEAFIIESNIELINGYIHIIDEVLIPVVYSSYEWLKNHGDYSIFVQALESTGLKDTFKIENVNTKYPSNTLLVESDEIFNKKGIFSISDLMKKYSPERLDYDRYSNGLYQFIAYHILEGKRFLNDFEGENTNFNTYASLPIAINATGIDIKINEGVEIFDTLTTGNDKSIIDFVAIDYDGSNVITKNGAIHFIQNVMELFSPQQKERIFQFFEEPLINAAENKPNTYFFDDPDLFEVLYWEGVSELKYTKSSSSLSGVWNDDFLELEGDFIISYEIPKILPGRYMLQLRANGEYQKNAIIQIFLDDKRIGQNIDLTSNPTLRSIYTYDIGQVYFINYEKHLIKIETLISGRLIWDAVIFKPV